MALLTYDGTAKDHEVVPEVLRKGSDGKPIARTIVRPAVTRFMGLAEFNLRGMIFPAGVALEVADKDTIKKAAALRCFAVEVFEGEPITYDKKWLKVALQGDRVTLAEERREAPKPETVEKAVPRYANDNLDEMTRVALVRVAGARGITVHAGQRKADIVAMLREQMAPAVAEALSEAELDDMQDAG